jgi:hypothetical protein
MAADCTDLKHRHSSTEPAKRLNQGDPPMKSAVPSILACTTAILSLTALTACGTTSRFVDQPHLTIDEPLKDARRAVGELFQLAPPYSVTLCEADAATKECKKDSQGVTATGVGGLLLPLTLRVRAIGVQKQSPSADGLAFDATLDARVDAISPMCGTVEGKIVVRDNNTVSLQLRNFYCNWMVVGNVIVNADFSMDSINLRARAMTGFYKMTFHGTGNAAGSGYYKAVITAKQS